MDYIWHLNCTRVLMRITMINVTNIYFKRVFIINEVVVFVFVKLIKFCHSPLIF